MRSEDLPAGRVVVPEEKPCTCSRCDVRMRHRASRFLDSSSEGRLHPAGQPDDPRPSRRWPRVEGAVPPQRSTALSASGADRLVHRRLLGTTRRRFTTLFASCGRGARRRRGRGPQGMPVRRATRSRRPPGRRLAARSRLRSRPSISAGGRRRWPRGRPARASKKPDERGAPPRPMLASMTFLLLRRRAASVCPIVYQERRPLRHQPFSRKVKRTSRGVGSEPDHGITEPLLTGASPA